MFSLIGLVNSVEVLNYLNLSILLFFFGLAGIIFNYRNFLLTMLSIELMYFGIIFSILLISQATYDEKGQIYALIFLILAACESAVGLGVLVVLYKFGRTIDYFDYQKLKG